MSDLKNLMQQIFVIENEQETKALGENLAQALIPGTRLFLKGDLGAGKTTFTRYVLQRLGHNGNVKSPTYTLVEPYQIGDVEFYHFDLYRLSDPEELEFLGIRDYFSYNSICFVEWADKGQPYVGCADLTCDITLNGDKREFTITAQSQQGESVFNRLVAG